MSLDSLLSRNVAILTAGTTTDRYNNTILDWSVAVSTPAFAWLAQTSAVENQDHRDATVTTLTATFAADAPLTALSRVMVDGVTYEVDGEPNVAHTPRGPHHLEAVLKACVG